MITETHEQRTREQLLTKREEISKALETEWKEYGYAWAIYGSELAGSSDSIRNLERELNAVDEALAALTKQEEERKKSMCDVAGLFVQKREGAVMRTLLVFKKGYWFFPGGKREEGESLHETLAREVYEELGLIVCCIPPVIHTGEFAAIGGTEYRFHTFTCRPEHLSGVPTLRPGDTVKNWVWADKPLELNLTKHARFIIEMFGKE